jgi:hypothetical protein
MLKFFKNSMLLLALSAGSLAFAGHHPAPGQYAVSADFLFLKPSVDDTYFVLKGAAGNANPNGQRANNDFDFEPGFRVGAVYALCDCNQAIEAHYSYLDANQNRTITGTGLWATVGHADLVSQFENFAGSASSRNHTLYQNADLSLSQQVYCSPCLDSYVKFGLEYAYFNFHEHHAFINAATAPPATLGEVARKSRAWGIGPQVGFDVDYDLYQNCYCLPGTLSLCFGGSGGILAAESNTTVFSRTTAVGGAQTTQVSSGDETTWRLIPALHARVGLNYSTSFGCYDAAFGVGYEFTSYIRGVSRSIWPDDIADGFAHTSYYNYDLQGLYVSAQVAF